MDCLGRGFPSGLKKLTIHPMAKLIAVADEFCERVLQNPNSSEMKPMEALEDMTHSADRLDPKCFQALMQLFKFTPSSAIKDKKGNPIKY